MLNKVILQGRLTAKPELKSTANGVMMSEFTVAWSEKYKEKETKCFVRCKAWKKTAEFISIYFDKGQEILIEGKLVTEQWESEGKPQSRTICQVDSVNFCGNKTQNAAPQEQAQQQEILENFVEVAPEEELPF